MLHGEGAAARQLIADMYGCCSSVLNDPDTLKETAHQAVRMIGAEIVEECVHRFSPVSGFQISGWKSRPSIWRKFAVNFFGLSVVFATKKNRASSVRTRMVERIIGTADSLATS